MVLQNVIRFLGISNEKENVLNFKNKEPSEGDIY